MRRPHAIRYRGHKYIRVGSKRSRDAAMPAIEAERKLEQVGRAIHRLETQGPTIQPVMPFMSNWEINKKDLLKSVDKEDSRRPEFLVFLIMWNPLTSEFIMGSNEEFELHVDLYQAAYSDFVKYPDSEYDDWARAYAHHVDGRFFAYDWEPLAMYIPYYRGATDYRLAIRLQKEGFALFKDLLTSMGLVAS